MKVETCKNTETAVQGGLTFCGVFLTLPTNLIVCGEVEPTFGKGRGRGGRREGGREGGRGGGTEELVRCNVYEGSTDGTENLCLHYCNSLMDIHVLLRARISGVGPVILITVGETSCPLRVWVQYHHIWLSLCLAGGHIMHAGSNTHKLVEQWCVLRKDTLPYLVMIQL